MAEINDHLSRIQTLWSKLMGPSDGADQNEIRQQTLLLRYYRAAFRYLLGVVRDPGIAEDLAQEFAVNFMRGDYRNVDRQRGRFRDFLKAVLRNLARDHWRKQERSLEIQQRADSNADEPAAPADEPGGAEFDANWREELLAKTWESLARRLEQAFWKALLHGPAPSKFRNRNPRTSEPGGATRAKRSTRPSAAEGLRQILHRAREAFGHAFRA